METKLTQLHTLKSLKMTEVEQNMMRAHGARVISTMMPVVTQSLFHRGVQHGLRIALSTFLFIVFVGSSVSVVANSALPGEPLYTFKVNVNEEVKGLFLNTPEEKVVWQKNRIENRMNEIKTLADSKTLTSAKQATLQKALDNHVKHLSRELTTLSENEPTAALNVTASLEESLKANQIALQNTPDTDSSTGKEAALKSMSGTLQKVSEQEVTIISKEIDTIARDVSTTPASPATPDTFTTPNVHASTTAETLTSKTTPVAP